MTLGGGDQLARGGIKAQFRTADVSQERWVEIFGEEGARKLNAMDEKERTALQEQALPLVEDAEAKAAEAQKPVPEKIRFRAVQDRIIVERVQVEDKAGQFYLPDEAKEKPAEGIVVSVGPGKWVDGSLQVPTIQVGDRVAFGKFSGAEIKLGLDKYLILREEDIFLVREN